jgi:Domain of unknown function (DUF4372)
MNRGQSVFAQLLGLVPFGHFEHLVDRFPSNHGIKHFSARNHWLLEKHMFVITDGSYSALNPLFPLIPIPFKTIRSSEITKHLQIVPFFIGIESVMFFVIFFYLVTDAPIPFGQAFLAGAFAALLWSKVLCRKMVTLEKVKICIVGIAPPSIWVDHFLLCITMGCGSLLYAKMEHLDLIGSSFFSVFGWLCFVITVFPVLNLMVYRLKSGSM